ncbi:MAG: prefoldin subunit alpha [Methanocellales archaeon]|nr:prefoldin subunit alpha [Methanocellales archaeon]MDD3291290.1 prefoldin subunit alpha [Methanocellales archaeon]MDD5235462.1 prefoldin subunit alpha [Methanocellales archaeon]MDD5484455.1 prefoldin subunit alpha [Methanocellales archaeon]
MVEKKMSEEELRNILLQLQQYQATSEALQQQIALIDTSIRGCESAMQVLDGLEGVKDSREMLVPIGAGSYIYASITSDQILMELGAGISAEKSVEEARQSISERKDRLSKMIERFNKDLGEIHKEMQNLQLKASQYG